MKYSTQTYSDILDALEKSVNSATWVNGDYDIDAYQSRALFTALCIMFKIEADTAKCDGLISDLFYIVKEIGYSIEKNDFYNFMVADII